MPIISKIGRRSLKTRFLIGSIYAVLTAGALTMIYPFLLLIAGSTKSGVDTPQSQIIPAFLRNSTALYRKYIEAYFNESSGTFGNIALEDKPFFESAVPPKKLNPKLVDDWKEFITKSELPDYSYMLSETSTSSSRGVCPRNLRIFKAEMSARFGGDLSKFNAAMDQTFTEWSKFRVLQNCFMTRPTNNNNGIWEKTFTEFKKSMPIRDRIYPSISGVFSETFIKSRYSNDLDQIQKAYGDIKTWGSVKLSRRAPLRSENKKRADWEVFVRDIIGLPWIRLDASASKHYRDYLKDRYSENLNLLNSAHGTSYSSFDEIIVSGRAPDNGIAVSDWTAFLQGWRDPTSGKYYKAPLDSIGIYCVDFLFQDFVKEKYGDIAKANSALNTSFKSWDDIVTPQIDALYFDFLGKKTAIRWEFCTRNFKSVIDYLLLHGSALFNTVIYCLLTIICALIVNPLAAYALSRFKLPSTYKILLFLMLTMAFPPVVTQIPNFLMLRNLGLLNTYSALILPGLANGYSIFLLKGFFDSLPQELYESASIDGASEIRIFFQITMSLSKPILAVIALNSFTAAYGNFMMALLVCQDRDMWTIMPFLFELQGSGCQGLVFASLLIAAIPTLIIFTFCQNIIMRGIVVPVEK